jgi:hypothetical protein
MASSIANRIILGGLALGAIAGLGLGVRAQMGVTNEYDKLDAIGATEPPSLVEVRTSERALLENGPVTIQDAMHDIATRGRAGMKPELLPLPSHDNAPLAGWGLRQQEVPPWMLAERPAMHAPPGADGGPAAPASSPDGGAKGAVNHADAGAGPGSNKAP